MPFAIAFLFLFFHCASVEGTYGLYSDFSDSYSPNLGQLKNGWIPLGSSLSPGSYGGYNSFFDTLNSEYSNALYKFGHQTFRIPVKGGITVVPAPKNLGLYNGLPSYGEYSGVRHIPSIKKLPLSYYGSLYDGVNNYKGSDYSLLTPTLGTNVQELSRGPYSSNIAIPTSHLGKEGYRLTKGYKSLHGSKILNTHHGESTPLFSDQYKYSEHILDDHTNSHLPADIGHGLTDSHHSGLVQEVSSLHGSGIGHALRTHSLPIVSSLHNTGLHDHIQVHDEIVHDHHEVVHDHDIHDEDHHYTSLEDPHHGSPLDGEVIETDRNYDGVISTEHKNHPTLTEAVTHKDSSKDYSDEESNDDKYEVDEEKYEKRPVHSSQVYKQEEKVPSQRYVDQKKTDLGSRHFKKDHISNYKSKELNIRSHEKPQIQHSVHRSIPSVKSYSQFPQAKKHVESYDRVKYAGGRYPVHPLGKILEQTHYEHPKRKESFIPKSYVQHKIEEVEHVQEDSYKPSSISSQKPTGGQQSDTRKNSYSEFQRSKSSDYKSGSGQPRGRTKIYRNYESPRTSSYDIEILHSDSSDQKYPDVENASAESNVGSEIVDGENGGFDSFPTEENVEQYESFDSAESQQKLLLLNKEVQDGQ